MKKFISFLTLVNLSTASFTNLISCATIEIGNGTDYDSAFNSAISENKKELTLDESITTNQTVLRHSPYAMTKYFIKKGDSIALNFKLEGIETYDQLITKYPEMKSFVISIFYGGIFASYGLYKDNSLQDIALTENGDFQYNKEYTFAAKVDGFLNFTNFPWFKNEDISKIRNAITVKSENILENLYYNFSENTYTNTEIWSKLYELEAKYKFNRASVFDSTLIPDNPFMILEGKKFVYVVEIKRLLTYLTFRGPSRDYHNYSVNALVNYLDDVRAASDENYGLNEAHYGSDYAPNYKLMAFDNDMGAGQYYATQKYISMHDVCFTKDSSGEYIGSSTWGLNVKTVYDSLILNTSLDLSSAKTDDEALKKMKGSINWGLWHETGHTYQNPKYKLGWWTEVTVNLNSFMISRKFYEKYADPSKFDDTTGWLTKWYGDSDKYISMIEKLKTDGIPFSNLDLHKEYVASDYGALFWFQLISAFGDEYIPILNHYYRININEITNNSKDVEKLNNLMQITSKLTKTNIIKFCDWWNIELTDETKEIMNSFGTDNSDKIANNLVINKWYESYEDTNAINNLGNYYDKLYHLPGSLKTKITFDETLLTGTFGSYTTKKLENDDMNFSGNIFISDKSNKRS